VNSRESLREYLLKSRLRLWRWVKLVQIELTRSVKTWSLMSLHCPKLRDNAERCWKQPLLIADVKVVRGLLETPGHLFMIKWRVL